MGIDNITKFLDDYLNRTGRKCIGAVEANEILAKAGNLRDSKDRPGKPLRDLLRKGGIPQAYQIGSSWVIPHSGKAECGFTLKKIDVSKPKIEEKPSLSALRQKLEKARLRYKPGIVKYLLVAEAPPDSLERFFYYDDVRRHDYLFLGVAEALYPDMKKEFLKSGRDRSIKNSILKKFQEKGFYLLDLSEMPLSLLGSKLQSQIPGLIDRINSVANSQTPIILIKASIFDTAFYDLRRQFNVVNKRITFPGQGGQVKFQKEFKEALKIAGYYLQEN